MKKHDTQAKVQAISDQFHAITVKTDRLLAEIARLTALAAEVRIESGMSGIEGQRTLRHLAAAQPHLAEFRNSLTLGHAAAEADGPMADFPWECPPEEGEAGDVVPLRASGE